MAFINFWILNATEIMQLCFGLGFLLLVFFAIQPLIIIRRLLKKADDLTDFFQEYLQYPIEIIMKFHRFISPVLKIMKRFL